MSNAVERKARRLRIDSRCLAAIDRLLTAGMKLGPKGKHNAINKVLALVPQWTRGDCWQRIRQLRKTPELAALAAPSAEPSEQRSPGRTRRAPSLPWSAADDDRLLNWAGYEPVKKIAQRLGRSERAVRFRMGALGMSARVTDGWSLRSLRKLLRVSPTRLRVLIGSGLMRVRDPRVTARSLAALLESRRGSLDPASVARITAALEKGDEAYSWDRAADIFALTLDDVRNLICGGQLKVLDPFVTDRQFEEFCKKHGDQINLAMIDPATAKWLVSEYGVGNSAPSASSVSRAQKHALIIRACNCGRQIAGNAYFRHTRACRFGSAIVTAGKCDGNIEPQLRAS